MPVGLQVPSQSCFSTLTGINKAVLSPIEGRSDIDGHIFPRLGVKLAVCRSMRNTAMVLAGVSCR
jgi:hypothetical protein